MKKTIFGSALMVCGMIAGCAEYLSHSILVAAPNVTIGRGSYLLSLGGPALFVIGLVLCVASLVEKSSSDK